MSISHLRSGLNGIGIVVVSEAISGAVGFFVLVRMARLLGPSTFATVEYAAVIAGLVLVWVRGGVESITHREAARRPSLIGPLSQALMLVKIGLALLGLLALSAFASLTNPSSFWVVLASGLILVPSALSLDVGPRALGQFRVIAAIQVLRAGALAAWVWTFVGETSDVIFAAGCLVAAEAASSIAFGVFHILRFGRPGFRVRWRAARVLAARGTIASLGRFGRVFLYAADLTILGTFWPHGDLGPYAASRRVVFAIVAVALAVPSAIAPLLAALWSRCREGFRSKLALATSSLTGPALAAGVGLALTSRGWMSFLFGADYERGSDLLALIAIRLPIVLLSAMAGAALVAIRREGEGARIVGLACVVAIVGVPLAVWNFGPIGAACGMLAAEGLAAWLGFRSLDRLNAGPSGTIVKMSDLVAILAMSCVVVACSGFPVWITSTIGAATFGLVRTIATARHFGRQALSEAAR